MERTIQIWTEIRNHHESKVFQIEHTKPIPRIGESFILEGTEYRVIDVTHDYRSALPDDLKNQVIQLDVVAIDGEVTREADS